MSGLAWTNEMPTREGWYIVRYEGGVGGSFYVERCYYVCRNTAGRLCMGAVRGSKSQILKPEPNIFWAGPIPEPAMPKPKEEN